MNHYDTLNAVLVNLFNRIMDIEQKVLITDEFSDISNNDMHIIEVIGVEEPKNMSTIAKALSVTVGTLTIAMNGLVKKGYVERKRSEIDKRVVFISLTDRGIRAFEHHKAFHKDMINDVMTRLSGEELDVLVKALSGLVDYFDEKDKAD
ncbi:MAG: MarR family winged helix-turn-helix transcriptional regulator [Lachnospiraceae bacterium]